MNSNIKGTMGCSSNTNTSTSLLKMVKGSNRRITIFDNGAQRELQTTSLASKLIKCVQCSEDDWMVWNFYYDWSNIKDNIADMVPKFLNVFHVCLKRLLGIPFFRCDCLFYDRWEKCPVGNMNSNISVIWIRIILSEKWIHIIQKYEFIFRIEKYDFKLTCQFTLISSSFF